MVDSYALPHTPPMLSPYPPKAPDMALGDILTDQTTIDCFNADRLDAMKQYNHDGQFYTCRMGFCIFQYRDNHWYMIARD